MTMTSKTSLVKNADMPEELKENVINICIEAVEKYSVEKDVASYIKKECDRLHKPSWHCIVGKNFGSYITHEAGCFIYLFIDNVAIQLFKSG
uniref:Dynein light chain n=1 Tax=Trichobilharzia regenti TaxID=157069 RepID=A0AA85JXC9_TRIRE|nr:unnamed protein product [Trichobilharzia regenti]